MAAAGGGQAGCAFESAAAELGDGVRVLQECTLGDGSRIRYQASIGVRSDEARRHGEALRDLFVQRFEDRDGYIADAMTGAGSSCYVRISAAEVQPEEPPVERMLGGLLVRLQGNKAVIPLAAIHADFENRRHMHHLFQKEAADFLCSHGITVIAVEADHGFWAQEEFGLEQLIDKRGKDFADKVGYTPQDVREFRQMRSVDRVPLLVGPLVKAADVPLPRTAAEAAARAAPPQHHHGVSGSTRAASKDWSLSPGKVELRPGLDLVVQFFKRNDEGTDRPTLGLGQTAGEAEAKAGRDLLLLAAAHACGDPAPELLCPDSSLDLAVEKGLDGIKGVKDWVELKPKLKEWRKSGKLQGYLQQVAGSVRQAGGQEGEGAAQRPRGRGGRATKRRAAGSGQAQRKKQPQHTAAAGAAQQAQQDDEVPAPQPATHEAQLGDAPAPAAGGQPAAAQACLLDLLLDAADQPDAAAEGLKEGLVGAYYAWHECLPEAQQAKEEAALRKMLHRAKFGAVAGFLKQALAATGG